MVAVVATVGLAVPGQAWAGEPDPQRAAQGPTRAHDTATRSNAGPVTLVTPARLLDTRIGLGGPAAAVAARKTIVVPISGRGGIPASNVSSVRVNLPVAQPNRDGLIVGFGGRFDGRPPATVT